MSRINEMARNSDVESRISSALNPENYVFYGKDVYYEFIGKKGTTMGQLRKYYNAFKGTQNKLDNLKDASIDDKKGILNELLTTFPIMEASNNFEPSFIKITKNVLRYTLKNLNKDGLEVFGKYVDLYESLIAFARKYGKN